METYSLLREFADSWMLLALTLIYVGVVVWAFRPTGRSIHSDTAQIPFRNDDGPDCRNACVRTVSGGRMIGREAR